MKNNKDILIGVIALLLICLASICCLGILLFDPLSVLSTPTPYVLIPIETIIAGTSNAAQMQTLAGASPIPSTLRPTWTPIPTSTLVFLSTQIIETQPIPAACSCTGDLYNCSDFSTHSQAQACFSYCISQGRGDIHKLDGNNDGDACESLP